MGFDSNVNGLLTKDRPEMNLEFGTAVCTLFSAYKPATLKPDH